jgi:hypothetical protein
MSNRKAKNYAEDAEEGHKPLSNPAHARAWELARQQGVKPIRSIEDLQGDFWPEEESVDEFLDWVRAMRQQDKSRSELE